LLKIREKISRKQHSKKRLSFKSKGFEVCWCNKKRNLSRFKKHKTRTNACSGRRLLLKTRWEFKDSSHIWAWLVNSKINKIILEYLCYTQCSFWFEFSKALSCWFFLLSFLISPVQYVTQNLKGVCKIMRFVVIPVSFYLVKPSLSKGFNDVILRNLSLNARVFQHGLLQLFVKVN